MTELLGANRRNYGSDQRGEAFQRALMKNQELARLEGTEAPGDTGQIIWDPDKTSINKPGMGGGGFQYVPDTVSRTGSGTTSRVAPRQFTSPGDTPQRLGIPQGGRTDTDALRSGVLSAQDDAFQANKMREYAIVQQRQRQAMMRKLTQAGYTPFNDVTRARQSNIYGV